MRRRLSYAVAICLGAACAASAQAAPLLVAGSSTYDPATSSGLKDGSLPVAPGFGVNNSGTAVGYSQKYVSGSGKGARAVRWDGSGTTASELGTLGSSSSGYMYARAYAVNDAGTAAGNSQKYISGTSMGYCAVRWDASGTAATELGNLGTYSGGYTELGAYAVNDAGTVVGYAEKFVGGADKGYRAVRWDASSTVATELGTLEMSSIGSTSAYAYAVNDAGTTVGHSNKFVSGSYKGDRAVRWDASGTAATELGDLGTDSSGVTHADAYAVNDAGTAVGRSNKYISSSYKGYRAVRWDASGTVAAELGALGTDSSGVTYAVAYAVNDTGTAVGASDKYVSGSYRGWRAVRWDASGTAATELGTLGISSSGSADARAYAVNDVGATVGQSQKYVDDSSAGDRAVIWLPDASVIDLNGLGVASVSGGGTWTLTSAKALSADGYVAGEGTFDPDGAGPLASYSRLWVAQVGLGGTWTKPTGGTWGRGPNWSTGTPAMQVGNATFDLDATYTVALDRDELTKMISLNAGTVTIDFTGHTLSTESGLSIAAGAKLKGAGRIESDIQNAGTIAPGNSPGTLIVDGDLSSTGTLELEIASLASHDLIDLTGAFSAGGTIAVKLLDGYRPAAGDTFDLVNFGSFTDNGYAFDFSQAELSAGLSWDTHNFVATGGISVIPEPGTLALLAMAMGGILAQGAIGRRRLQIGARLSSPKSN